MIALYILGGLLLFLFFLLMLPLGMELSFDKEFFFTVQYLFLRFRVFPGQEKQEGEPPEESGEKKEGTAGERLRKIIQKKGVSGFLSALSEFAGLVKDSAFHAISHIRMRTFDLYFCVGGGEDAAQAAIRYGTVCGIIYSASGILLSWRPCKKKGVSVNLDYAQKEDTVKFTSKFSIRPIFLVKEGLHLFLGGFSFLKKLR